MNLKTNCRLLQRFHVKFYLIKCSVEKKLKGKVVNFLVLSPVRDLISCTNPPRKDGFTTCKFLVCVILPIFADYYEHLVMSIISESS